MQFNRQTVRVFYEEQLSAIECICSDRLGGISSGDQFFSSGLSIGNSKGQMPQTVCFRTGHTLWMLL